MLDTTIQEQIQIRHTLSYKQLDVKTNRTVTQVDIYVSRKIQKDDGLLYSQFLLCRIHVDQKI